MKTKSLFALSLLLGAGALSSCSNDNKDAADLNFTSLESISATIEGQGANSLRSKLVYDDSKYKTVFTADNVVVLTDLDGNTATFANSEANVNAFSKVSGSVPAEKDLYACYPASAFSVSGTTITYTAPKTQTYTADENGYIAEGTCPMMAMSNTGAFDFKNFDCLLKVNVNTASEALTVKSIKLCTNSGALSGTFTANYNAGEPALTAVEGSKAVTLDCGDGVAISSTAKAFYIAIPAGTYEGLQVQVNLSDGSVFIDEPRAKKTFARSMFYTTSITVGATPSTGVQTCVDLGLPSGTLWATCNVGATKPTEAGYYFAWGETDPAIKSYYGFSSYKFTTNLGESFTKYTVGGLTTLEAEDDAATVNWGSAWRMPTLTEQKELLDGCTWEWTTNYNESGVKGLVGTAANGNKIFLPSVGYYDGSSLVKNDGCYFWSSTLHKSDSKYAYSVGIAYGKSKNDIDWDDDGRFYGQSVRAVVNK